MYLDLEPIFAAYRTCSTSKFNACAICLAVKPLSSTTTTQKVQAAHVRDPSITTIPGTANKRYDYLCCQSS